MTMTTVYTKSGSVYEIDKSSSMARRAGEQWRRYIHYNLKVGENLHIIWEDEDGLGMHSTTRTTPVVEIEP